MARLTQAIPSLKGGISQQPDHIRYPDQAEFQYNGWSSEVEGLQKRPPIVHIANLDLTISDQIYPNVYLVDRDDEERYYVVMTGEELNVIDLEGRRIPITYHDEGKGTSQGYVVTSTPRTSLKLVTVADYTFIVNTDITIKEYSDITHPNYPAFNTRCIINIRGGQYGRTFSIYINGASRATLKIADGGTPSDIKQTDAQWICQQIQAQLITTLPNWQIDIGEGFLLITAPAGETIEGITTADGYNNQLMNAIISDVQTFTQLPARGPEGYIVKVNGQADTNSDDYYVRYDSTAKVWKETAVPYIIAGINKWTMPHALIRQADGTFLFTPLTWATRNAGDDDTNPMPSFVDNTITDIFFYRNRLGFLSGENVILSKSGQYFSFFPSSVATIADDDPIDVAISHNKIHNLLYAIPFNEELLLWSKQAQFVLSAQGTLTSKSISLELTSEFTVTDKARPLGIGKGVYFISERANYSSIWRYFAVEDVTSVKDATEVTAHTPLYIPNGIFKLTGSPTENYLAVLTTGNLDKGERAWNKVYFYKFLYVDTQVVQEAVFEWEIATHNTQVYSIDAIGSAMYVLTRKWHPTEGWWHTLEKIEFTGNTLDFYTFEKERIYMDSKKLHHVSPLEASYIPYQDITPILLRSVYGTPSEINVSAFYVVTDEGRIHRFPKPEEGWNLESKLLIPENQVGRNVLVGMEYEFKYTFSKFLIKDIDDQGNVQARDIGRFQVSRAWVSYNRSGYFAVDVVPEGNYTYTYEQTGGNTGEQIIGGQRLSTGKLLFPVAGRAVTTTVTIRSAVPSPVTITGAGFEGNYVGRITTY